MSGQWKSGQCYSNSLNDNINYVRFFMWDTNQARLRVKK